MDLTIRIPDDTAARLQAQAQARGLTVDRWLLELVEQTTLPATNHEPEPVSGMVEENGLRVYRTGKPLSPQLVDDMLRRSREARSLHLLGDLS